VFTLAVASLVAGCAFGRKQEFDSARLDVSTSSRTISVAVLDHRPYVVSKDKSESFTGLSRGGFGNPFDVTTKSGQPLATDMANALASSLRAKGATVNVVTLSPLTSDSAAMAKVATVNGKGLLLEVAEWKSDKYMRTKLAFDLRVFVVDPKGRSVGESHVDGTDDLGPGISNMDTAPVASFSQKMNQLLAAPAIATQL
jgi:hypothetical protein